MPTKRKSRNAGPWPKPSRWRTWRAILDQKNEYIKHARRRARLKLCKDAAGQIYVGRGARGQFGAQGEKDGTHEIVQKLWTRRVTAGKADFDPDPKMDSLETKDAADVEARRMNSRRRL